MTTNTNRRNFILRGLIASAAAFTPPLRAQEMDNNLPKKTVSEPTPRRRIRQTHDLKLVTEFVSAAHRDIDKVKEMVAGDNKLVFASVDTGNVGMGDWETALNGAAHTGRRDIALFLLSQGARIDAFCAAMLGYRSVILELLNAAPATATIKGPHGLTLLYHTAIGGDVAIAQALKPLLPPNAPDFNQALSAAARGGHLKMTEWLLANGVSNVDAPDGFKKTPLKIALEKGFSDVATVLRQYGGHETL